MKTRVYVHIYGLFLCCYYLNSFYVAFLVFWITLDVINLVNDPTVLTDERINSILQKYNTQNFVSALAPHGKEVHLLSVVA